MADEFYIPRNDKGEIFKIRASDNAIILFLNYFGYSNIHVTLYVKDVSEDERIIDIHLTDDKNNKKIYHNSIKFNLKSNIQKAQERVESIKDQIALLANDLIKKKIERNDLFCLNCYVEKDMDYSATIKNKQYARNFYEKLLNREFFTDIDKLKQYSLCVNKDHDTFISANFDDLYMKTSLGIFRVQDYSEFGEKVKLLLLEAFEKEKNFFDQTIEEIKQVLERYKDE